MGQRSDMSASELRQQYAERFPAWTQQCITRISGKPASGQQAPRSVLGPWGNTAVTIGQWPASVALGCVGYAVSPVLGVLLTPVCWLLALNSLRRLQVVSAHHAVHREIAATHRANYLIQAVVSALSLVHNWEDYFADHVRGHHSRKVFTTAVDPDAAFLLRLGLQPGLPPAELAARLRRCVVSPRFHWLFLHARLHTNFVTAPWHRRLLALLSVAAAGSVFAVVPWPVAVLVVVLPLFPLYHVSGLLQFVSEHDWLLTTGPATGPEDYARRTRGRFCLLPLPDRAGPRGRRLGQWLGWTARVLVVVLPSRYGVLVGDLPAHDLHHLYPNDHDWTRALWRRQRIIDEGDPRAMAEREYTSLGAAVDSVLVGMSRADGAAHRRRVAA